MEGLTGVLRLGGPAMSLKAGDSQAASGGRRNVPLVPSLASMGPTTFIGHGIPNIEPWAPGENLQDWREVRRQPDAGGPATEITFGSYRELEAWLERHGARVTRWSLDGTFEVEMVDPRKCLRIGNIDLSALERSSGSMSTGEG